MSYNTDALWTSCIERTNGNSREGMSVSALFYKDNSNSSDLSPRVSSVSITETVNDSKFIVFGSACSNTIEIVLLNVNSTEQVYIVDGGKIVVGLGVGSPLVFKNLGTFYIDEINSKERQNGNKDFTIKAYDGFCKTEKPYVSTITTLPTRPRAIISDIASQCGIEINTASWNNSISIPAIKDKLTCRQTIGYLAGIQGCFARFNRSGQLEAAWYSPTTKTITQGEQYLGGFKQTSNENVSVAIMETGTTETPITFPVNNALVGRTMNFENPYMTQQLANSIGLSKIYSFSAGTLEMSISYMPCSVEWVGNPEIQAGDIVSVVDKSGTAHGCYVMNKTTSFDGGLKEKYFCYGESENSISFSPQSPTDQKIQRAYSSLESAIKTATELISGTSGGYVKLIDTDDDGYPDNLFATDVYCTAENISENGEVGAGASKVVRINYNGIGVSNNGGNSYITAITGDGINADCITAGTISTDRLSLGAIGNGITIRQNQVTGLGDSLASVNALAHAASESATTAEESATMASLAISSWAMENNTTYIDGAKIYTGTLSAQSIIVGDYTNYVNVNELTYRSLVFSDEMGEYNYSHPGNGDYPNSSSYTKFFAPMPSGNADRNRTEFLIGNWTNFDDDGREFSVQGELYPGSNSDSILNLCLQVELDSGSIVTLFPSGSGSSNTYTKVSGTSLRFVGSGLRTIKSAIKLPTTFVGQPSGTKIVKMRPLIACQEPPVWAGAYMFYFRNLSIRRTGSGDIVAGKISPIDGNVYFDLENKELAIGDEVNKTSFSVAGSSMTYYQGLYHLPLSANGANNKVDAYSFIEFSDYEISGIHRRAVEIFSRKYVDIFSSPSGSVAISQKNDGTVFDSDTPQILIHSGTNPIYINGGSLHTVMVGNIVVSGGGDCTATVGGNLTITSDGDLSATSDGTLTIDGGYATYIYGNQTVQIGATTGGTLRSGIDISLSGTMDLYVSEGGGSVTYISFSAPSNTIAVTCENFTWYGNKVATIADINEVRSYVGMPTI